MSHLRTTHKEPLRGYCEESDLCVLCVRPLQDQRVVAVCIFYKSYPQAPNPIFEQKVLALSNDIFSAQCARRCLPTHINLSESV